MRQTKLDSSLVNFRAHYKIVWLYFTDWLQRLATPDWRGNALLIVSAPTRTYLRIVATLWRCVQWHGLASTRRRQLTMCCSRTKIEQWRHAASKIAWFSPASASPREFTTGRWWSTGTRTTRTRPSVSPGSTSPKTKYSVKPRFHVKSRHARHCRVVTCVSRSHPYIPTDHCRSVSIFLFYDYICRTDSASVVNMVRTAVYVRNLACFDGLRGNRRPTFPSRRQILAWATRWHNPILIPRKYNSNNNIY